MAQAADIWRRKSDEEVLLGVSSLAEYTEEGQRTILAEARHRGINVDPMLRASAALIDRTPESAGRCAYCDSRIFFGRKREGALSFCSQPCRQAGLRLAISQQVAEADVKRAVSAAFNGRCPRCGGDGPVDVHTSYRVYSALIMTSWTSRVAITCTACGRAAKLRDALFSVAFGWWGLPWGIVMTPIQCGRNIAGLLGRRDNSQPSTTLERIVRLGLAEKMLFESRANGEPDTGIRRSSSAPGTAAP